MAGDLIIGEEVDGMALLQSMREEASGWCFFPTLLPCTCGKSSGNCLFDTVHDGVYSYDVGARKPHQRMYEDFERRHGRPDYYFDDRIGNIEAARQRGWPAFQFDSIASAWAAVGGSCG